jgi:hypothetical protein
MISATLTTTLKNIIQSAGLYDSGRLYNNTIVSIKVADKIYVNIETMNYFVYLNQRYRLTQQLENSEAMAIELENIYAEILNAMVEDAVNGKATQNELPIPVLLVNGY